MNTQKMYLRVGKWQMLLPQALNKYIWKWANKSRLEQILTTVIAVILLVFVIIYARPQPALPDLGNLQALLKRSDVKIQGTLETKHAYYTAHQAEITFTGEYILQQDLFERTNTTLESVTHVSRSVTERIGSLIDILPATYTEKLSITELSLQPVLIRQLAAKGERQPVVFSHKVDWNSHKKQWEVVLPEIRWNSGIRRKDLPDNAILLNDANAIEKLRQSYTDYAQKAPELTKAGREFLNDISKEMADIEGDQEAAFEALREQLGNHSAYLPGDFIEYHLLVHAELMQASLLSTVNDRLVSRHSLRLHTDNIKMERYQWLASKREALRSHGIVEQSDPPINIDTDRIAREAIYLPQVLQIRLVNDTLEMLLHKKWMPLTGITGYKQQHGISGGDKSSMAIQQPKVPKSIQTEPSATLEPATSVPPLPSHFEQLRTYMPAGLYIERDGSQLELLTSIGEPVELGDWLDDAGSHITGFLGGLFEDEKAKAEDKLGVRIRFDLESVLPDEPIGWEHVNYALLSNTKLVVLAKQQSIRRISAVPVSNDEERWVIQDSPSPLAYQGVSITEGIESYTLDTSGYLKGFVLLVENYRGEVMYYLFHKI